MTKPVVFTQSGSELVHNAGTPLTLKGVVIEGMPSVPFTFSALIQPVIGNAINGINQILPYSIEIPHTIIGDTLDGYAVYLDTQRGTYWGDITISVTANAIYDVTIALPTIDNTQCNSLVELLFNGAASAGQSYPFTITATGGDFSISRTFTLTTDP
jgi:hypothetical protein